MLIRFTIENVFSFGERKEFNMLPYGRLGTLKHHLYKVNNFNVLKMASIYGANGAGKSNLIKALQHFQNLVLNENVTGNERNIAFKFNDASQSQLFVVEFIQDNIPFYYGIEVFEGLILTEELYESGLGIKEDKLIFERKTTKEGKVSIQFMDAFENDLRSQVLKSILLEEFIKPKELILKILSNRENQFLQIIKKVFRWFEKTLNIITPESKPRALAHRVDVDTNFRHYAESLMCSFNIGITSLNTEKKHIRDFFGIDNENELKKLILELEQSPNNMIGITSRRGDEIIIVKEEEEVFVKRLKVGHLGKRNQLKLFNLEEVSDGTIRLLDFIPALQNILSTQKVFIIDEIERSIHPLLIKELIRKVSLDENTKGQLIFTTHESNLLDQKIFRQDEIWFVEKDKNGSTDLYALSDFKREHNTINIQKGYLNGRYGSIPFLANLTDLNWQEYVINE
ncbi:MAG: ATP/GTP-binding protein [Saprospiraceae bacterium]